MEQTSFVQGQLWVVIGLMLTFVVVNLLIARSQRRKDKARVVEPRFDEMWKKDELDELLDTARSYINVYPNHQAALYYLAKALMARGQYANAKPLLERLLRIEPAMRKTWQRCLDEINSSKIS